MATWSLLFQASLSQQATSCGGWCRNVAESATCSGCNGTSNCVSIPLSECQAGYWPDSNSQTGDKNWIYSRSTHYGGTPAGACGYANVPNCYADSTTMSKGIKNNKEKINDIDKKKDSQLQDYTCDGIPDDVLNSKIAGYYAAPQGDYYAQNTYGNFLSCGACFEIKCVDDDCSTDGSDISVYVQIADSCPCVANTKWCCNIWSHCNELGNDSISNQPHCYQSDNGLWSDYSIHLDLNDRAFNKLTTGDPDGNSQAGVVNTMIRRISCPAQGNAYLIIDTHSEYKDDCYTVYGHSNEPCFYYLAVDPYNIAGFGTTKAVFVYGGRLMDTKTKTFLEINNNNNINLEDTELVYSNFTLLRNPNYPTNKTQEQYGNWVNEQNVAIFFPIQFYIEDGNGRVIGSERIYNFTNDSVPEWLDMGENFSPVDENLLNVKYFHGH